MPAEARIAPIWKKQKLFVALFMIGLGCWFLLDGARTYPRSNIRWQAYEDFKIENRLSEWPEHAKAQGWVEEQPHKLFRPEDIVAQFVFGGFGITVGAIILAYWYSQIGGVLKSDADGITTQRGVRVPFDAITGVGKKQWDKKGIATVRYELAGRRGQFIVDDYKYDTEPSRQILAEIEEKLLARTPGN